jgi:hypothetical protein
MNALTLTHELAEIRAQIARLQDREARLQASLRNHVSLGGERSGWPIQRVSRAGDHGEVRT